MNAWPTYASLAVLSVIACLPVAQASFDPQSEQHVRLLRAARLFVQARPGILAVTVKQHPQEQLLEVMLHEARRWRSFRYPVTQSKISLATVESMPSEALLRRDFKGRLPKELWGRILRQCDVELDLPAYPKFSAFLRCTISYRAKEDSDLQRLVSKRIRLLPRDLGMALLRRLEPALLRDARANGLLTAILPPTDGASVTFASDADGRVGVYERAAEDKTPRCLVFTPEDLGIAPKPGTTPTPRLPGLSLWPLTLL